MVEVNNNLFALLRDRIDLVHHDLLVDIDGVKEILIRMELVMGAYFNSIPPQHPPQP